MNENTVITKKRVSGRLVHKRYRWREAGWHINYWHYFTIEYQGLKKEFEVTKETYDRFNSGQEIYVFLVNEVTPPDYPMQNYLEWYSG